MKKETLEQNPSYILMIAQAYAINDLDVEPEMKDLLNENLDLINKISPKEAYELFSNFMMTNHPDRYIREFKEVFFRFIPGLKEIYKFEQNNPWHIYDVFEHTMHVIENTKDNKALRIAALFHDIGKPRSYSEETKTAPDGTDYKVGHFYGHAKYSKEYFSAFAERIEMPKEEKELIENLIVMHDYQLSTKPVKMQQYIDTIGKENIPLLFALKRADNLAQNPAKTEDILKTLDEQEQIFMDYIKTLSDKEPEETPAKKNH